MEDKSSCGQQKPLLTVLLECKVRFYIDSGLAQQVGDPCCPESWQEGNWISNIVSALQLPTALEELGTVTAALVMRKTRPYPCKQLLSGHNFRIPGPWPSAAPCSLQEVAWEPCQAGSPYSKFICQQWLPMGIHLQGHSFPETLTKIYVEVKVFFQVLSPL